MGCNTSTASAIPTIAGPPNEAAGNTETQNKNDVRLSSDERQSELPGDSKEQTPSSKFNSPPLNTDANYPQNGNRETVPIRPIKKGFSEQQCTEKSGLAQEEQLSLASVSDDSKNFSSTLNDKKSSLLSTQEKKDAFGKEVVEKSVYSIEANEQSSDLAQQHVMDLPDASPLELTNQKSSPRDVVQRFSLENCYSHDTGEESPEIKENQEIVGTKMLEQILHSKDKQNSVEKSCEVVHEVLPVELPSAYEIETEHSELEQRPSSQGHLEILVDPPIQDSNSVGNVNQLQSAVEQEELDQSDVNQSKKPIEENARNNPEEGQSENLLEQETQDKPCVNQSERPAQQEAGVSVCNQERFNQGLRSFCRLVDSEELLGLADPHVSNLTLERAPAGQGFPFKKFLQKLTGITELNLSGNQLGPQAFRVVAMAVCHNKTIQSLDLSNNFSDTDSSECLGKMLSMNSSLIKLNVSSNQLGKDFFSRCVGPALGCNKTLKTLSASSCGISNLNVLLENLLHNSTLEELDISHNHMTDSQDFAQRLNEILQSQRCSLKTLQLRNCGVGVEGMRLLMEALSINTSLERLHAGGNTVANLSDLTNLIVSCIKHPVMTVCNISDTSVTSQEPTFMVNGNRGSTDRKSLLTSLNLAKCSLTDDIIASLANNVPGSLPHLSELDLTGNTAVTAVALGALSTLLTIDGQPSNLKCLLLGSLSINGLSGILQGSSTWAILHTLDLKRSKVTPSEVSELGSLCQRPSALIDLCLEGLKLSGSDALIGLFASSGSKCSLQSLSLASCALQDSDLQPITTAITEGLAIYSLKLSANRITDKGAVSLMESFLSIGDCCSLVELNLSNNRLTDECADTAAKMLVSMPRLRSLLLGHNSLGGEGLTTILTALNPSESSSLRILDVSSQDSHLDETDLVDLLSLVAVKLGYMVEEGDDGMTVLGRSPLPSHPHGLTIRLAGLGGSPDNGQYLDSLTVKTDYTYSQSPALSLQHVLEIADWLKGSLTTGGTDDCSMTAEEWSQVIGLAKDPSVPSWLQVSALRSLAIYLTGLPASVSAGKLEGDLESEADCLVKEVFIMKDFIQRKPNGIAWVLLADDNSVHKALNYFYEGKALMFSQPYMISCIKLSVTAKDSILEDEKKASRDLAARAQETARDDAEHRALLVSSYQASQERHEFAKANPAYADGRIW